MADDENSWEVDLWGNRVYSTKGKRGRPPFQRTEENANKVSMLLALGWSNDRIASCILDPRTGKEISEPTLKRHFRSELQARKVMRDRLDAKRLMATAESAFGGNVGAQRLLDQLMEKNDRMLAEVRYGKPEEEPKPKKLGKKEISDQAAHDAESDLEQQLNLEAGGALRH